jgi:hypothetical protein
MLKRRRRAKPWRRVNAWAVELLGLAFVLCFGAAVYLWHGAASTWCYAGFVFLTVSYVVAKARAGDQVDEP